jgi:hypothetical protein
LELLTNGLLLAATLFAGGYCWVLARRVRDLKSLDRGLGKSIVTLTRQIELARTTLEESRQAARISRSDLSDLIAKAEDAAKRLTEAAGSAQDAERGLRYQLSQASDRKRSRARDLEREAQLAETQFAEAQNEQIAAAPRRASSNRSEPADGVAARRRGGRLEPEKPSGFREAERAGSTASRAPDHPSSGVAPGAAEGGVPSVNADALLDEDGDEAKGDASGRPLRPSAEEIEPWRPSRRTSVLRAGADLLTLKPLRPKAAKTADLPKPPPLPPLGNPLRGKSAVSSIEDEDELLAALSQLAAGGKR